MRRALPVALLLISVAANAQERSTKPPWDWTVDERLARRFNSTARPEREGRALEYSLDGRRNPELFLPHELFDWLLFGLSPDEFERTSRRNAMRGSIRELGYNDAAFWPKLESAAASYLAIKWKVWAQPQICAARFDALQNARRVFGKEEFDRLLYTVVAPSLNESFATIDPNYVDNLRKAEEGCR